VTSDGAPVLHLQLPAEPASLRLARRSVSELAGDLRSRERADLMLLLSELISWVTDNELRPVTLDVERTESGFRVEATSSGHLDELDELTERIFEELAANWSLEPGRGSFELDALSRFTDLDDERELFDRLALGGQEARDELAQRYRGFALSLARRFVAPGVRREDLNQVALVGLMGSLERYDIERGVKFTTFAGRTIEGELKRHLRDSGWSIRVPRGLQELGLDAAKTSSVMAQRAGRRPTLRELAESLDAAEDEVGEALLARRSFDAASLNAPISSGESFELLDALPSHDERLHRAPEWSDLSTVMDVLPERERHILYLRFFEDLSQSEIAARVGVSQMHVSRLLARSIDDLREVLNVDRAP